jgi:hypothetical protein
MFLKQKEPIMATLRGQTDKKSSKKGAVKTAPNKKESSEIAIDWKKVETVAVTAIRTIKSEFNAGEVKFRSNSTAHKRIRQAVRLALREIG